MVGQPHINMTSFLAYLHDRQAHTKLEVVVMREMDYEQQENRELSMSNANIALWQLMDDSLAQDAEDYMVTCDKCAALITEDQYGEHDGLCEACHDAVHFTCPECGETYHCDEHHDTYTDLCENCGAVKREVIADGLWSEIEDLAGSWLGEATEISKLQKLLAYAKKLK